MGVLQVNVWNGLAAHLDAVSSFKTAIGGRIYYGIAPEAVQRPYAVVTFIDDVPFNAFTHDGYETRVQFSIYGDEAIGHRSVIDIADKLRERLHRVRFTVVDHEPMQAVFANSRGALLEDQLWRMDMDFILRGFESGS